MEGPGAVVKDVSVSLIELLVGIDDIDCASRVRAQALDHQRGNVLWSDGVEADSDQIVRMDEVRPGGVDVLDI